MPANETLSGPQYTITLSKFTAQPKAISFDSTQRVIRIIGNVQNGNDLARSKSTTGQAVFSGKDPKQLNDAAAVLTNFPAMLNSVDARSAKHNLDKPAPAPGNYTVVYQRDNTGKAIMETLKTLSDDISWLEDKVKHVAADLIHGLKDPKRIAKFAIQFAGEAVGFVFWVGEKVLGFAIQAVAPLLAG